MPPLIPIFFGAALTVAAAYAWGAVLPRKPAAPPEIVLAVGVTIESLLVFFALLLHQGTWPVFLALGLAPIAVWAMRSKNAMLAPRALAAPPMAMLLLVPYLVWYAINALAPEVQPDGITYHLGLPYQYIRLHGFADRISFYNVLPQGMEMLYTMAFAFGRHSAAKLVSFALLVATLPLIVRIGRMLGLAEPASVLAAAFYFTAPVVGLTGSSSYNDASLVLFTLAAFYLLLEWRESGDWRYMLLAGLTAGFCYAIKIPGIATVAGAAIFVLAHRRLKPRLKSLLPLAAGAIAAMAPWMIRDAIITGNPLAPLMNAVFRNPHFHIASERAMAASLASYGHVPLLEIPWQLAFGDQFAGTFGPLVLALPLVVLGWRNRTVRLCLAAALIAGLPWLSNKGARFLMPALPFAALALGKVLPRRAAWAALALQAILCWPWMFHLVHPGWAFRLDQFPWRAALRIEPEAQYLGRQTSEYRVARMIERRTPPGARVYAFGALADAYLARDVTVAWQSAAGECLADPFWLAARYPDDVVYRWRAAWDDPRFLMALRFRLPRSHPAEWDIREIELYQDGTRIPDKPEWMLRAKPNRWEMPLALDNSLATRWRTWEPMRAGMYTEVDFERPERVSAVALVSQTPAYGVPLEIYGKQVSGQWRLLSAAPSVETAHVDDLRLEATGALRKAGFGYLVAAAGRDDAPFAIQMKADPLAWDLEWVDSTDSQVLFRIR